MALILPNPNPSWIYEGFNPANFEDATGINTNRAPKQIHANVVAVKQFVDNIKGAVRLVTDNVTDTAISQLIWVNSELKAINVNLPSSPAQGDWIAVGDYKGTFENFAVTILAGAGKINNAAANLVLDTNFQVVYLEYVDSTIGWRVKFNSIGLAKHLAAVNPHPQYTTEAEATNLAVDNAITFTIALG